jgi:hypothetical protein
MRRVLAALALLVAVALSAQSARAQDGYIGGWTDPEPTASRDGKPLAYLDSHRVLMGEVSHPNGIQSVSAVLVVDPNESPATGCDADVDPNVEVEQNGTTATFRVNARFPCNLVYELRATAQANADEEVTGGAPPPFSMPLLVGVAIPPAPVSSVDATLDIDGDEVTVTLEWPAGPEPDLLGYVVNRVTGDDTESLGQVDATEHPTFVDEDPPAGTESRYDVIAMRQGPDEEVEQVAAEPTSVTVDVPGDEEDDDSEGGEGADGDGESVDPQLAGDATPTDGGGRPAPGSLSSVRIPATPPRPTTPTTLDTGFDETIDYGESGESGEVAAVPPGDNSVVAMFDDGTTGSPWSDEETMTFVAGGLAVLSGAGTILTVTRRAARGVY